MSNMLLSGRANLGAFWIIAADTEYSEQEKDEMAKRYKFWPTAFRRTVPIHYAKVSRSPTWILATDRGEILLEGIEDLSSYINAQGEFVDPNATNPVRPETESLGDLDPELQARRGQAQGNEGF
jgi:hypothetical protein